MAFNSLLTHMFLLHPFHVITIYLLKKPDLSSFPQCGFCGLRDHSALHPVFPTDWQLRLGGLWFSPFGKTIGDIASLLVSLLVIFSSQRCLMPVSVYSLGVTNGDGLS